MNDPEDIARKARCQNGNLLLVEDAGRTYFGAFGLILCPYMNAMTMPAIPAGTKQSTRQAHVIECQDHARDQEAQPKYKPEILSPL